MSNKPREIIVAEEIHAMCEREGVAFYNKAIDECINILENHYWDTFENNGVLKSHIASIAIILEGLKK